MPRAAANPNVAALRRNLASDAFSRSVRSMGGADTAVQRRNFGLSTLVVTAAAIAFTAGGAHVFNNMAGDSLVCDDSGAHLYTYANLFISRVWLSAAMSGVLFLVWNPRSELATQSTIVRLILQLRNINGWFGFAILVTGNVFLNRASPACVKSELYRFSSVLLYLSFAQLLAPLVLLIVMLVAVCCCLPCVLSILVRLRVFPTGQTPGSEADIAALPESTYHAGLFPSDESSCAICTEEYKEGEQLRLLPCSDKHHFHKDCVDRCV